MTSLPAAPSGLEMRLRERADSLERWAATVNDLLSETGDEDTADIAIMRQSADALAKARVALEAVQFVEFMDGNIGTRCVVCGGRTEHGMSCNIGAAIEALNG